MIRGSFLLLAAVLAIGIFVPQVAILLLVVILLLGLVGIVWTYRGPFDRRRRGGRR
ncbi:hypothetical protein NS506_07694 [Nocardia seriolae]|uniref:Uncharacterized protein n=1 Tax=Nocardia seriolae TaxID=37332 RepID=A0ABC8B6I8_9NOCA|nr:hypothetical protein NS506_07694 [Nocardia seriolae]GAM44272.1 hypothetical protein NS07_v2contig00003-0020 [Nocardia seriolae]GEM28622.1 hypothetical protein NS2_68610 [Nocardia seriolae NBRC 15557]